MALLSQKDKRVFKNLTELFSNQDGESKDGVNTRAIANASDLDIYSARYSLLKLARLGYARNVADESKHSHIWFPSDNSCVYET